MGILAAQGEGLWRLGVCPFPLLGYSFRVRAKLGRDRDAGGVTPPTFWLHALARVRCLEPASGAVGRRPLSGVVCPERSSVLGNNLFSTV